MNGPRFVKLNLEIWISENEWESLECCRKGLPTFAELQKVQAEKDSINGEFPDALTFFSEYFGLIYHGDDWLFYGQQDYRRNHARMMEEI